MGSGYARGRVKKKGRRFWLRLLLGVAAVAAALVFWYAGPGTGAGTAGQPFDVIVVGGEPEGVAAAVAASRAGAETLLLERRDGLGGLMTYGMLNTIDMNRDPQGKVVTRGLFTEFYQAMSGEAFDVGEAKDFFARLVGKEAHLQVKLGARFVAPVLAGQTLVGVEVEEQTLLGPKKRTYYGRRFIDATQDADLAAASGVPYTVGAEDRDLPGEKMVATLMLHVGGVDWAAIRQALNTDADKGTGASNFSAWGFLKEARGYQPQEQGLRLRGLNIGRQKDGTVLINALQIFGVDGLIPASYQDGMRRGQAEAPRIVAYLRQRIPGFSQAYLIGTAPELYVRETRHVIGEYQLTINDLLENRDFPDTIAIGSYPVDIQPTSPDNWGYILGDPIQYGIPFRCLVPREVENLLVVGRAASFTSLAAGSARTIPVGMATGQAAGVAAAMSLETKMGFRQMAGDEQAVTELRRRLVAQGAYLEHFHFPNPDAGHWAYPAVRSLRETGLVSQGYAASLELDRPVTAREFRDLLWELVRRYAPENLPDRAAIEPLGANAPLTKGQALALVLRMHNRPADPGEAVIRLLDRAWEAGAMPPVVLEHWEEGGAYVTRGVAYAWLNWFYQMLRSRAG
ncbi:MAG: FAD-dependent oxidoreductase [Clostridia bacterium]|nr:MAG: FAD-dependent oxidoreductase [Clostridia bacterium]